MTGSASAQLQLRFLTTARERVARGLGLLTDRAKAGELAAEFHTLGGEAAMVRLPAVAQMAWQGENAARRWGTGAHDDAQMACERVLRELAALLTQLDDRPVGHDQPAADAHPGRILVVDDSALAAQALADAFEVHGFDVRSATTLAAVLETCMSFWPDVLVADVNMPSLDVVELCRRFRDCHRGGKHAVVLMSAHSEAELRPRLGQIQPDAFVCKLEGADAVVARVEAFTASHC